MNHHRFIKKDTLGVCSILLISHLCSSMAIAESEPINGESIGVESGVLAFTSKDSLSKTINHLKQTHDDGKEVILNKYYNEGFMPLYPHFSENDIEKRKAFYGKKKALSDNLQFQNPQIVINDDNSSPDELDDNLIADDDFASLLNDKREIIVGDKVYKYTYSGIFSSHIDNKEALDTYIQENNLDYVIPDSPFVEKGEIQVSPEITKTIPNVSGFQERDLRHSIPRELIKDNIQSFPRTSSRTMQYPDDDCQLSGDVESGCTGGGGGSSRPSPTVDHTKSLMNMVAKLGNCETHTGGLFGFKKNCYASWDSKHRTKTRFWRENYLIWKSTGVSVRHQIKGFWGIWAMHKTDELALVLHNASFEYPMPTAAKHSEVPGKYFTFNGKTFNNEGNVLTPDDAAHAPVVRSSGLNGFNDIVITEYIGNSNQLPPTVEIMGKLFYDNVWDTAVKIVGREKNRHPKNATYIAYTNERVFVTFVDLDHRKTNSALAKHTFDLTVLYSGSSLAITDLAKYKSANITFVGAGRRGNSWVGSKMSHTDHR